MGGGRPHGGQRDTGVNLGYPLRPLEAPGGPPETLRRGSYGTLSYLRLRPLDAFSRPPSSRPSSSVRPPSSVLPPSRDPLKLLGNAWSPSVLHHSPRTPADIVSPRRALLPPVSSRRPPPSFPSPPPSASPRKRKAARSTPVRPPASVAPAHSLTPRAAPSRPAHAPSSRDPRIKKS